MRILLLVHGFNSLAQRLHVELIERGHAVSVEYDVNDAVTREAIDLFDPDLVLAAFNDAQSKALELAAQKMNAITGGVRIPGLM